MEVDIEKVASKLNLDKRNWTLTKFGDVAIQQKGKVDRENTNLTRYVQGGHMNSEDLHIRTWGDLTNEYLGPAFIRKFEKGDILYGSRRTYLRKVAIADFDGITSNTTFVIKANELNIDKRLLPFIMMSEGFTDNSIKNSKGSVNPYINWKDIAKYQFLLPPKDQQAQLAELLWAMDEVVEKKIDLKLKSQLQYESSKNELLLRGFSKKTKYSKKLKAQVSNNWKITNIGDLIDENYILKIQDGNHGEVHPKSSDYVDNGIPFIMANTLIDGRINIEKSKKLPQHITDRLRIGFALPGDILLSHKGTVGQVALIPNKIDYPYFMLTPQVTFYRCNNEKIINEFLYYIFNSQYFQNQLIRLSSQSTRAYVGITAQRNLKLILPKNIDEQKEVLKILKSIESNLSLINKSLLNSKSLQKTLINQIF